MKLHLPAHGRILGTLALIAFLAIGWTESARAVDVKRVVSPGGIEAWYVHDTSVPLVAIEFVFRGGAASDPKGKSGLANLTASLLDEGAGDLDSQAFQSKLQNLSIKLSFGAGYDSFSGSLKTLNRNRDEAVRLLRLALTQPRFDAEPVQRLKAEIVAGLKRRSTRPGYIARRIWQRAVFPDHPYGLPVAGTESTLKEITADDLRNFTQAHFAKDRLLIGVSGDISEAELGTLLDDAFGALPDKAKLPAVAAAAPQALGDTFVIRRPVPQSVAVFGLPGLARSDPDFYVAYVMNHVLGGGSFQSWLYEEVREKRGLAYSVYSYLQPREAAPLWMGSVATANAGMATSMDVIRAQVQRMRDQGVTETELEDAKLYINGSFPLRFTSSDRIASILVSMQFHNLGIGYLDRRAEFINAVTREDIARLAKRILDPQKLIVTVVGEPKGLAATSTAPDIDS
ncbi:MAG: insulinase family protein [Alphaproteobacteria bacterium]|nr:insulinase family protein [Alphaproteobacteria bacterium]